MKFLVLITAITMSTTVFAAQNASEDKNGCFQTDKCIQVVKSCKGLPQEDWNSINHAEAAARIRVNVRYGCPTNTGIQYVWEEGQVRSWNKVTWDGDTDQDKATVLRDCQASLANLISEEGSCSK